MCHMCQALEPVSPLKTRIFQSEVKSGYDYTYSSINLVTHRYI